MFLAGNLRKSLLALTIVSGLLALFFAQRGVDTPPPTTIEATETTINTTTTTIYVAPIRYIVQRGDTLFRIAETNRLDMRVLMEMNGITDPDRVEAGQELIFPPANGFIPVAPSTTMKP
jgi:LysM repeat protein